ncbi:MAG TPA: MFS transporter [Anaerolineales bacterium]|nr:MFS transporter [Anaerolineales bacterium]
MAGVKTYQGMRTFLVIWFGQLISTLGSGLTGFALGVWIYQETGSTTLFAMNMLAYAVPNLLVSPLAGALVDRWDRRVVMILSDTGAGLSTLVVFLLLVTNSLEIWHVYIITAISAAFSTFQWPAYSAATSTLVPKEQLGRAGGLVQIGEAISQIIAPGVAGALYVTAGLQGVILIDVLTFVFAVGSLLVVKIPRPEVSAEGEQGKGSLWKEATYGWKYIIARPGLLGLLSVFAATNFFSGIMQPLLAPLVLDMTSADMLGYLGSVLGVGMLLGTLLMSAWGGPRRKVHGVLGFLLIGGIFTSMVGLRPSIPLMTVSGFLLMLTFPIVNGSSQAIWQSKVALDVQGRVFSVRRMIAWSTTPIAFAIAGPLADGVFKPLLLEGGGLAGSVGQIIGVGPGRGVGLMFILIGLFNVLVSAAGYLNPRIYHVEDELPDAVRPEDNEAETLSPSPETTVSVSGLSPE